MKSWVRILIGLLLGIIVGAIMGPHAQIFHVVGVIFINLMTMLVIPIILSSFVVGICHIRDPKKLGRIGFRTIIFFVITTLIAIAMGIFISILIKPGEGTSLMLLMGEDAIVHQTKIMISGKTVFYIILFSIFLAIALIFSKEKGRPVVQLLESLAKVTHLLTHYVMMLAPIGIFALMASTIGSTGWQFILRLVKYLACNYIAAAVQLFIVFTFLIKYFVKVKVAPFFKGMKDAIVMAFTTGSSSATLPVTLECAEKHLGVSEDISGFVLSLGSTINMNGGAIGQVVSAIFISQVYGIALSFGKILLLVFFALISSIGAAGIPGSGIMMMSIVLSILGLPLEGIGILAGVDRLREMVSSVVNILGDAVAALIVSSKEGQFDEKVYYHTTWLDSDI